MNKHFRVLLLFFLQSLFSNAQTPVWIETFGYSSAGVCDQGNIANGFATSNGAWTVTSQGVNDSAANEWYISAAEAGLPTGACSSPGCFVNPGDSDRTLHVGSVFNSPNALLCPTGDCGAIYDPGDASSSSVETHKRAESPAFPMTPNTTHLLVFNYIEVADSPVDTDEVLVYFFDGAGWSYVANPPRTNTSCGTGSVQWERYSISLPVITSNANVKIGFLWKNDNGGIGASPSFAVDSIFVFSIDTAAHINVSDTDICVNTCLNFSADTIGVGATYDWVFNGATPSTSTVQNPTNICYSSPGTYTAFLTASKPGYSDSDSISIVVNPCTTPTADFSTPDTVICMGDCITFSDQSSNGVTGWNWSFPGGTPSSSSSPTPPQVCYNTPGFYDVTLIAFNSFGADTMVKTSYIETDTCALPEAGFTYTNFQTCPQFCVTFMDTSLNGPILTHEWTFPGGAPPTSLGANPGVCYAQEGVYDVQLIVTNRYGGDTLYFPGAVIAQFNSAAGVSPDTVMLVGSSYQMHATGGVTYLWMPATGLDSVDSPDPIATPNLTTTYTVTIADSSGCRTMREVTVTVLHDNNFFVPNSFSPNGDGKNDFLYVRGNNFHQMDFAVFDRWGEKVFETTDPLKGWDGTYKGKNIGPGVFSYVLTINYSDDQSLKKSGSVMLVR